MYRDDIIISLLDYAGSISSCDGSALVRCGGTLVTCGVKAVRVLCLEGGLYVLVVCVEVCTCM